MQLFPFDDCTHFNDSSPFGHSSIEDSSFLVSTEAVVGELDWNELVEFEVEIDDERHYAAIRMSVKLAFEEYDKMMPVYLIICPQDIRNVRVLRRQEAHHIVQDALRPSRFGRKMENDGAVAITISKKPPTLVLGLSDGMSPQTDKAKHALKHFKEMARSHDLIIYVDRYGFEYDQLHILRHALKAYELYPDELTKPSYEGLKVISKHRGLTISDSPTSSDERASSSSPSRVPGGRCKSSCSYSLHFPTHTHA